MALISGSCRKNHSCACTTTLTKTNSLPYQTATIAGIEKKTSRKKAKTICDNTAKQMQANTRLLFDDDITVETGCTVQE